MPQISSLRITKIVTLVIFISNLIPSSCQTCDLNTIPITSYNCTSIMIDSNYKCCMEVYTYNGNTKIQCKTYSNGAADYLSKNIYLRYTYICQKEYEYYNLTQFDEMCSSEPKANTTNCWRHTYQDHKCCLSKYSDLARSPICKPVSVFETDSIKNTDGEYYLCSSLYIKFVYVIGVFIMILLME